MIVEVALAVVGREVCVGVLVGEAGSVMVELLELGFGVEVAGLQAVRLNSSTSSRIERW